MDTIKQQLDEIKETIKKAEEEKTKALTAGQVSLAEKVQDQINKLEDQKFFLMQQLGESQPPERRKFCAMHGEVVTSQRNLGPLLETIKRVPCIPI